MRAAVIDFETTGMLKSNPRFEFQPCITQIGLIVVDENFNVLEQYSTLINPDVDEKHWEATAIEVTGIGPEEVKDAPTFFLAFSDFATCVLGCDTWAGYNCSFDQKVLWWQLQRTGLECHFPWPPRVVDVMQLASRKCQMQGKQGVKNPKLSEAYELLTGSKFTGAHDALEDVGATIEVWKKCV